MGAPGDQTSITNIDHTPGVGVALAVTAWGALMWYLGSSGLLRTLPRVGPLSPLQLAIVLPVIVFLGAARLGRVRAYLIRIDPTWLTGAQVLRILGTSHLITWGLGLMAGGFALPVGLGNLGISLMALSILPGVAARSAGWERRLRLLSWLGLAEFAMTITLAIAGFLTVASPIDPAMALDRYASIVRPPISLFPTFLIPLFSVLHCATLFRLGRPDSGPVRP